MGEIVLNILIGGNVMLVGSAGVFVNLPPDAQAAYLSPVREGKVQHQSLVDLEVTTTEIYVVPARVVNLDPFKGKHEILGFLIPNKLNVNVDVFALVISQFAKLAEFHGRHSLRGIARRWKGGGEGDGVTNRVAG